MAKETYTFDNFMAEVTQENKELVNSIHEYLTAKGFKLKLELGKSGFVASYFILAADKKQKTVLNYVFRKKGMFARIYGDHLRDYMEFINSLPEGMKASIEKSPVCKRMINPEKCNSRCSMGYDFVMDGEHMKKCRYNAFLLQCSEENNQYIKEFVEKEAGFAV